MQQLDTLTASSHTTSQMLPPLPLASRVSRFTTRHWVIVAAALGGAACTFAGLYPQFDNGALRPIIAATTLALSAVTVWIALFFQNRAASTAVVLAITTVLGAANTIIPCLLLSRGGGGNVLGLFMLGVMFGAPVGFLYGIPLAILVVLAHPGVYGSSLDRVDAGKFRASIWLVVVAAFAVFCSVPLQQPQFTTATAIAVVLVGAVASSIITQRRLSRSRWTSRIRAGQEPLFRVRELSAYDPPSLLRVGEGATVVEWAPLRSVPSDGAYRSAVVGVPLAIVSDR